ncbi:MULTISPECIES: hypothetical protein, partial [unclassified Streptomyces]|uniref:hypothetical protein n=1 Tax=unclassified Streptomyces TaxID=2593676 RepID=UPI001C315EAC
MQSLVGVTGFLFPGDAGVDARRAVVDLAGARVDRREQLRVDIPAGDRLLQVPDCFYTSGLSGLSVFLFFSRFCMAGCSPGRGYLAGLVPVTPMTEQLLGGGASMSFVKACLSGLGWF